MTIGVSKELVWVFSTLSIAVTLGWLWDATHLVLFSYIVFYITRNLLSIQKFERWIREDKLSVDFPSSGLWAEVINLVDNKIRRLSSKLNLQHYNAEQNKEALMRLKDGIVSLDARGKIEWFNWTARKKLKLNTKDIATNIELIVRIPAFIKYLNEDNNPEPLILHVLQGIPGTVSIAIISYYKDHRLIIIKDIHELYNASQIHKDFIANASHELRTPLTVINGYVEVMLDENVKNKWQKPLEQMHNQSARMQSIIDDLLTLSSLESENVAEELAIVDVPELLNIQQETSVQISQDSHKISFDVDENLLINGYIKPLTSIFSNLIYNAISYSPKGGVIIIKWYKTNNSVVFSVEDHGIGITQKHLARVTERFYRVDGARSREGGGTGLGLSIVKYALETHKAKLIVESKYGLGSKFTCKFPVSLAINAETIN